MSAQHTGGVCLSDTYIYIWIGVTDIEGEKEACGVMERMLLRLIRLLCGRWGLRNSPGAATRRQESSITFFYGPHLEVKGAIHRLDDVENISRTLGHSSIRTTHDIYGHVIAGSGRKASECFIEALKQASA